MTTMKLDGYIRVSRVNGREGDSFISPDVQRESIEAWAKSRDAEIVAWHTDLDETGGKLSRPGINAAMDRVRSGKTEGIAVARLDRLSRAGVGDALRLVEEIHQHGGKLAAVDLGVDPTTPFGEFGLTIMLALARMERRRITDTWEIARGRANKRGIHQSKAPFGYARGEDKRLVPDESADWVRLIFRRRAAGDTWADIARYLNEQGVETPGNGTQWVRATVSDVADNEVYLGIAYHGDFRNETAHEAIVTRAQFDAAKGKSINPSQVNGPGNLLAGLLRCGGCSYCLSGGRTGSPGKRVRQYSCTKVHASGTCQWPAGIRAAIIEPWIVEQFFAHIDNPRTAPRQASTDYTRAREVVEQAKGELRAYLEDTSLRSILGDDEWKTGMRARKDALTLAERELHDARQAATGVDLPPVADLREWWPTLGVQEQRLVLSQAIDAVMVKATGRGKGNQLPPQERARILWRGQAPDDLPRQGKAGSIREFVFAPDYLPLDVGVALANQA